MSASSEVRGSDAKLAARQLELFSTLEDPADMSFSAIIDVLNNDTECIELSGSPILVNHARKHARDAVIEVKGAIVRAPELRVVGKGAEEVAYLLVKDYSKYVGALFDNFE